MLGDPWLGFSPVSAQEWSSWLLVLCFPSFSLKSDCLLLTDRILGIQRPLFILYFLCPFLSNCDFFFFKPKCHGGNTLAQVPEIRTSLLRHGLWRERASILPGSVWPPCPNKHPLSLSHNHENRVGRDFFFEFMLLKTDTSSPNQKKKNLRRNWY